MPYELDSTNIDYLPLSIFIPAKVKVEPNTLNKASQGDENTATAYIEIPGYDINEIDLSTVMLNTNNGKVSAQLSPTVVGDYDGDDIPDRMIKFDRQAVFRIVETGNILVTVSGKIARNEFTGSDKITVIDEQYNQFQNFPQ